MKDNRLALLGFGRMNKALESPLHGPWEISRPKK